MTLISRLRRDDAVLLVVDVQEKLVPAMFEAERVVRGTSLLARAAKLLDIPVVVTEQNPNRLGATVEPVVQVLGSYAPVSKMRFSACVEETTTQLRATNRKSVILCGLEAHVCVLQSALDLVESDFTVFLPQDAVSSRYESDKRAGLERMKSAGAIPASVEMLIYELLGEAGTDEFRALLPFIK
ncbi:MAG TPA: hydrolase [Abditibacteriaceae bacterium]|nr:hydrolase [Abditibacteriaceae bacterium]